MDNIPHQHRQTPSHRAQPAWAVFLPNWVGDAVMATPALRAVKEDVPSRPLVGVMRPHVAELLSGTDWLDEVLIHDPRSDHAGRRTWAVVRRLRQLRVETALILNSSFRTALVAVAAGAKRRVGFARNLRSPLLTHRLHAPRKGFRAVPYPAMQMFAEVVEAAGVPRGSQRLELTTTEADERAAGGALAALGLDEDRPLVVFNSGGAFGPAKLWPAEYFGELAVRMADELGVAVLVLCGPREREEARRITAAARHPQVKSLADAEVSLGLSKACVRRSRLLVTTDSGPRHFAAAFDVPVVTLFGPTHMAWSENGYDRALHLQRRLDCGPCQQRACPLAHHRCMRELSVDEVYEAVCRFVAPDRAFRAA